MEKDKKQVESTPEVARILRLPHESSDTVFEPVPTELKKTYQGVSFNLPSVQLEQAEKHESTPGLHESAEQEIEEELVEVEKNKGLPGFVKALAPFIGVFIIGLALYFFFFSNVNFNFGSWFSFLPKTPAAVKNTAMVDLEKQNAVSYDQWISGFYYDVSDPAILDPEADNSGNGLTNFEKYLLDLNPKSYDTLGLGMADSQALAKGINPLTGLALTSDQQQILNKYFDMETIMNRLTVDNLQKSQKVAGANTGSDSMIPTAQAAGNNYSILRGGSANTQTSGNNQVPSDINNTELDIDTNVPGNLTIPSLNVNAPLIWSTDSKNFDNDLKNGVIHYPGTALPGQVGTTYISGHSSNYIWIKSNYNHIFTYLNDLKDQAGFSITVTQKNGQKAVLHYMVIGQKEYSPTDQAQFANGGQSIVQLSTCWPVGSTTNRLVVTGLLTQIDR